MFTVIIPVYEPKDIGNLLDNLNLFKKYKGTYGIEIFLIDDCSEDQSYLNKLDDFDFLKIYKNTKNLGKASSINRVIQYLEAPYVCILDHDDLITEEGLIQRANYAHDGKRDLLIGAMRVISNDKVVETRQVPEKNKEQLISQLLSGFRTPFHLNAVLFKKELLIEAKGMDPFLRRAQDVDLSVKLLKKSQNIKISDSVHYVYYKHRENLKGIMILRFKTAFYRIKMIVNNKNNNTYYHICKSLFIDSMKIVYSLINRY